MARQGGRVQLEQSDMHLTLNTPKSAKERFMSAAIVETQQLFKKPHTDVRNETKWGVLYPGHRQVKGAIKRHPGMI